jgi:DNA repair photolyase
VRQPGLFDEPPPAPSFPSAPGGEGGGFIPLSTLSDREGCSLKGIARLAAAAEEIDERNEVEYRDLPCRSLIAPCESARVPFQFSINPYRGCELGCSYCYARYTHEFMELEEWKDFERKIFVKTGAREALVNDLRKRDLDGKWIAIGTATDPYQPAERRYGITRSILEVLAARRGLRLSITTKSDLVTRDLDLLQRVRERNQVEVNVTVTTPHYRLSRKTEPRAPRPDRRLAAVRALAESGLTAGVFIMPILPRITDSLEDLDLLIGLAREAGASYVATQVLFLRKCSKKRFYPWLEEEFPGLLPCYRRLYASYHTEALQNYTRQKIAEVHMLKRKHGLTGFRSSQVPAWQPDQLSLNGF